METLIVKVKDSDNSRQRVDFLLELLRGLPDVEVEVAADDVAPDAAKRAQRFLETAGQWADRDVDAADLRQRAWTRGNSGS